MQLLFSISLFFTSRTMLDHWEWSSGDIVRYTHFRKMCTRYLGPIQVFNGLVRLRHLKIDNRKKTMVNLKCQFLERLAKRWQQRPGDMLVYYESVITVNCWSYL